jgi:hypothetical protein
MRSLAEAKAAALRVSNEESDGSQFADDVLLCADIVISLVMDLQAAGYSCVCEACLYQSVEKNCMLKRTRIELGTWPSTVSQSGGES